MAIKLTYLYKEYKDCPEATEISRSRSSAKGYYGIFCIITFILSILFCSVDSADRWIAICGVILCPVWFVYLLKFYDKKTDVMIKQALESKSKVIIEEKPTEVNYINQYQQKNNGKKLKEANQCSRWYYELECLQCGHKHYANYWEIETKRCPNCQY